MKGILNKRYIKGFTLVELIIVITILGILATIAFISFQGYSKNARDGNRIATLKNIGKGLEVYKVQTGNYPQPDDSINIEASGTVIGYQGNVGDSISRLIKMNVTPTDPSDKEKYLYSISGDKKKYQVLGYLETTEYLSLLPQSYAVDYSNRYIKMEGDKVGIVLDANKNPLSGVPKIEVATGSTVYNVYFGDKDLVNGSGNVLYSNIYTRRSDLQNNKTLASLDNSLVGYWDMETLSGGKLRDFSKYSNDGTLSGGVTVGGVDGVKGKAISFDGIDDVIYVNDSPSISFIGDFTIYISVKPGEVQKAYADIISKHGGPGYIIEQQNTDINNFHLGYYGNSNWRGYQENLSLTTKDYQGISFVKDGTEIRYYLNGILKYKIIGQSPTVTQSVALLAIGGRSTSPGTRNFNGNIDEIFMYNRALSDSEIKELYNSTK